MRVVIRLARICPAGEACNLIYILTIIILILLPIYATKRRREFGRLLLAGGRRE